MKTCTKCQVEKRLEDFSPKATGRLGRQSRCKSCQAEYTRQYISANRPEHNLRVKRYAEANWEKVKKCRKSWEQANWDRAQARKSNYRARKRNAEVETVLSNVVFERDAWICQLCFLAVPEDAHNNDTLQATVDHVVPLTRGGFARIQQRPAGSQTMQQLEAKQVGPRVRSMSVYRADGLTTQAVEWPLRGYRQKQRME